MAGENGYDARLEIIEDFIPRIAGEIAGEVEGQTGDGDELGGYAGLHGNHRYIAVTSHEWEHLTVRYNLNADAFYHAYQQGGGESPTDEIEVTPQEAQEARRELEEELQDQPTAPKRELRLNLKQVLGREGCSVEFDTMTEPYNVHGYNVSRKVFPRQDEFFLRDFEKAVQNVISFGWTGKDLLLDYYGLQPDSEPGAPGY